MEQRYPLPPELALTVEEWNGLSLDSQEVLSRPAVCAVCERPVALTEVGSLWLNGYCYCPECGAAVWQEARAQAVQPPVATAPSAPGGCPPDRSHSKKDGTPNQLRLF